MALNGMFVEAASVTADQQWRTDTSAEWSDGPIDLGAMRFQPTQIVEVRDRPAVPDIQPWGPDDQSDAALRSGRWEVAPGAAASGDTPTQIRFVRPGNEHGYSTLDSRAIVGTRPFEAWRTILAALFRPRPLDADHLLARLTDDLEERDLAGPDLSDRKALRAELADADPNEPAAELAEGLVLAMPSSSRVFAEIRDVWVETLTAAIEAHRGARP